MSTHLLEVSVCLAYSMDKVEVFPWCGHLRFICHKSSDLPGRQPSIGQSSGLFAPQPAQTIDELHHWQIELRNLEISYHLGYTTNMTPPAQYKASWYPLIQSFNRPSAQPPRHRSCPAHFFLPDFLIPCCPVFMGPFPPAFLAISSRAFLSAVVVSALCTRPSVEFAKCAQGGRVHGYAPACCFARYALSSSSSSFFADLGFLLWIGLVPAVF